MSAAEAHAIPGLWADVDYTDDAHTKPGLPAKADALRVLMQDVETPTILVSSGHGYQPWWLFDEPWVFASAMTSGRKHRCSYAGGNPDSPMPSTPAMDSTHDLARVLRVPGTLNRKGEPFVPVTAEVTGARRTRDLWVQNAVSAGAGMRDDKQDSLTFEARQGSNGLLLTADRAPDPHRLADLIEAIPDVDARLKHQGLSKDQDQSLSGYDMSLVSFAIQMDWSDQEIVDLCLYHRRRHTDNLDALKLDRPDYWHRTISAARDGREPSVSDIVEQELSELGGLGIQRVLEIRDPEHPDAPPYRLISDRGVLELPSVAHLTRQLLFRDACFVQLRRFPPMMKGPAWDAFVRRLMEAVEEVKPGDKDHPRSRGEPDETREWVEAYLHGSAPSPNAEEGDMLGCPFEHEGVLHFPMFGFRLWLKTARGEQITKERLGSRLRDIGAENVRITVGGRRPHFWMPTG